MTIAVISMIRDPWGGSEELWYQMALQALDGGHLVIHLRYETSDVHPKMKYLIEKGLIAYTRPGYVPQNTSTSKKIFYLGKNFLLKKIDSSFKKIFDHKPDVVVYNGTCYSIALEKALHYFLLKDVYNRIPFYIIGHLNSDFKREVSDKEAVLIKQMYNRAEKVFFVSNRNKETAERHLCTKITNAAIIRNPVNMQDDSYLEFPSVNKTYNFALVGNLVTIHKGQDILLQVLANEEWKEKDWRLNIYGSGYDEQYLKSLVEIYALNNKVIFHGKVTDIRKIWSENHMLLMPSHMEGMPLAVVEAMLCGRPCLVTDVGGHVEWIDDGITGFVCYGNNVIALNNTLQNAWQQRGKWEEMGRDAHQKAVELYEKDAGKKLLDQIITY